VEGESDAQLDHESADEWNDVDDIHLAPPHDPMNDVVRNGHPQTLTTMSTKTILPIHPRRKRVGRSSSKTLSAIAKNCPKPLTAAGPSNAPQKSLPRVRNRVRPPVATM
jgi:hypothetical protein